MRSRLYGTAVLCGCLLALPATAADKNNNADAKKGVDGGALAPGYYTGKLVSVPGSDGAFTVNVETDHFQPNPNAAKQANQEQQQIVRLQTDLANARNPKEYNQRLQRLANELEKVQADALKPNGKLVKEYKEVDFRAADAVKVRVVDPPAKFDDKGNPVVYTKAELKELKGKDADLPGYEAAPDALKTGDTVKVTLSPPQPAKKDADKKGADVKKGNEATVILILAEGDGGKDGKKK